MVGETNKLLRSKLPKLLETMSLYLANKDTESILFKPVKVGIQEAYRDFRKILDQHYRSSEKRIAPKGLGADISSKESSPDSGLSGPETGSPVVDQEDDDEDIRIVACPEAEELNLLLASIISTANSVKTDKTTIPLPALSNGNEEGVVSASS